jgi:hypothetical protein
MGSVYSSVTIVGLRKIAGVVTAVAAFIFAGWICTGLAHASSTDAEAANPAFFTQKVKPILVANCYRCHSGMNHRGGFSLGTKAGILKGGKDGPVVVPGDPTKSLLVRLIHYEGPRDDPKPMPPKGKLSDQDIATIERWIRAGAIMPADPPRP